MIKGNLLWLHGSKSFGWVCRLPGWHEELEECRSLKIFNIGTCTPNLRSCSNICYFLYDYEYGIRHIRLSSSGKNFRIVRRYLWEQFTQYVVYRKGEQWLRMHLTQKAMLDIFPRGFQRFAQYVFLSKLCHPNYTM